MVRAAAVALFALLAVPAAAELKLRARGCQEPQPSSYRNAWEDCGGKGASATERMRSIAASIKGFAKEVPFKRSAAQDCGSVDSAGMKPGPVEMVVYPNPGVMKSASDGLLTAE